MKLLAKFFKNDSGATAIEYGLIAAVTGLAIAAAMPSLKSGILSTYTTIGGTMN